VQIEPIQPWRPSEQELSMRFRLSWAVFAAVLISGAMAPQPAHAIFLWYDEDSRGAGLGPSSAAQYRVRAPRYYYRLHSYEDPFAYRYEPRGYYPYYGAGYWRPAHTQRRRYDYEARPPHYHPAWGYGPRRCHSDRWGHRRCH
jgi:hypothetical protein